MAGNYDTTVALGHPSCGCQHDNLRHRELSALSYRWTRDTIGAPARRYLASLPFRIDLRPFGGHAPGRAFILVHGAATLNTVYWREDRSDRFCDTMIARLGAREGDAIFFGHTHKPWTATFKGRTLVNTGSAGRPKDGDPRASYAVVEFDRDQVDVCFPRVAYDLDRRRQGHRRRWSARRAGRRPPDRRLAPVGTGPQSAPGRNVRRAARRASSRASPAGRTTRQSACSRPR